jgi:hypothetical protein
MKNKKMLKHAYYPKTISDKDINNISNLKFNPNNKLITEEEMMKESGKETPTMSADSIPDLEKLTDRILELIELSDTSEMIEMEKNDNNSYEQFFSNEYLDIPLGLVRLLLERDNREKNLKKTCDMIETLIRVKSGHSDIDNEFENFNENLNKELIYPQFGGKEAFQAALINDAKNKKNKKNIKN